MTEIAFVGNEFAGDISATGSIQSVLRIAAPQLANALDDGSGYSADTIEWIAFDPSSVGLDRARGSLAIEVDVNPPVVWLKQSVGGGSPTGWIPLESGSSSSSAQAVIWPVNTLVFPAVGEPMAAGGGVVVPAQANAQSTARVLGLWFPGQGIQSAGPMTLTTAQWDARVTGQSGGLTPFTDYYLDAAAAGKLTVTPPSASGDFDTYVGTSLTSTTLVVAPASPVGPL